MQTVAEMDPRIMEQAYATMAQDALTTQEEEASATQVGVGPKSSSVPVSSSRSSLSIFFVLFHCFRLRGRSGIDEELQQDTSFTLVTLEPSLEGSPLPIFKEILATTDHLRKTGNPTISKGGRRITKFGPKAEKERAAVAKSRNKKKERELEVLSKIQALEAEKIQLEANIVGLQEQLAQCGKITAAHLDQQPEAAPLLGMRPY